LQDELEQIIEDCAGEKFEKMAEIKFLFKNCDEDGAKKRDEELLNVKKEMEVIKTQRVQAAKDKMQEEKKRL